MKYKVIKRFYYVMETRYLEVGEIIKVPNKYLNVFKPYLEEVKKKPARRKKSGGD